MLNSITLIGRTTRDVDLRFTQSGVAVANFTLAVERDRKGPNGEKETDFIEIVVWSKLAELTAQFLKKGKLAAVNGSLQIRSYENRDGQKVRVAEVVAYKVRFLEKADSNTGNQRGNDPFKDDGRPTFVDDSQLPF